MQRPYRGITKDGKLLYGDKATADDRTYIIGGTHDENGDVQWLYVEVIPSTVGQSTGLKDRNGVEIFEGNKIKLSCGCCFYTIEYQEGVAAFVPVDDGQSQVHGRHINVWQHECEVIGTIHDHLLEQSK